MPLYDITNKSVLVKPKDAENYIVLVKLKATLPTNTWNRLVQTVDDAIDSCQPSKASALVWTRSAALFGEDSKQPLKYVEHLWEKVTDVLGANKLALKAVGGLLRWRISLRDDTWLVYRRDSDKTDPENGKLITVSEYWINNSFVPPTALWDHQKAAMELGKKWGAKIT